MNNAADMPSWNRRNEALDAKRADELARKIAAGKKELRRLAALNALPDEE